MTDMTMRYILHIILYDQPKNDGSDHSVKLVHYDQLCVVHQHFGIGHTIHMVFYAVACVYVSESKY